MPVTAMIPKNANPPAAAKTFSMITQRQFIWKGDFREQFEPDNVLP